MALKLWKVTNESYKRKIIQTLQQDSISFFYEFDHLAVAGNKTWPPLLRHQCLRKGRAGQALGHRAEGRQEQDYADGLTFDNVGMFIIFFILFGEGLWLYLRCHTCESIETLCYGLSSCRSWGSELRHTALSRYDHLNIWSVYWWPCWHDSIHDSRYNQVMSIYHVSCGVSFRVSIILITLHF